MKEKQLEHSALLGRFVGMVQAMEDALPDAQPKSPHWGVDILPLLSANIHSTLQMFKNILTLLPEETAIDGTIYSTPELLADLQEIDVELLRCGIDSDYYEKGYREWHKKIKQSTFSMRCPLEDDISNHPSYHLGVILANLRSMEAAAIKSDAFTDTYEMDDILLLLETNLESTMQLVDKLLSTLPEHTLIKGSDLSVEQLKKSRSYLNVEEMEKNALDMSEFRRGFRTQTMEYLL